MDGDLPVRHSPAVDIQVELKKRKLRKGTTSCWECKRRKTRCTFVSTRNSICDGCNRRKTACISQEFPEEPSASLSGAEDESRLARLENVVKRLLEKAGGGDDVEEQDFCDEVPLDSRKRSGCSVNDKFAPVQDVELVIPLGCSDSRTESRKRARHNEIDALSRPTSFWATSIAQQSHREHLDVSSELLTAWPSQQDLEVILSTQGSVSALFHGTVCPPSSTSLDQTTSSLRNFLLPPTPGCHYILIARKLLLLATYLQSLPPSSSHSLQDLSIDYRVMMSLAVETTHHCLTSNDDLLKSIEGVECLLIESMYQNNAGDLLGAWHLTRKAMLVAQMMGLHQGAEHARPRFVHKETQQRVRPDYVWLRIIQTDRYLSLMLGLPQGSLDTRFADQGVLRSCTPLERMQRLDCLAGGYILQRNESGIYDLNTTQRIDELLRKSAASLPAKWWLPPNLPVTASQNNIEAVENILRVVDQFAHYNMLVQLHLPYLLRSSTTGEYNYGKITAINASREILTRFVLFSHANSISSFCSGINYVVFTACTAICIAHIDAHRRFQSRLPYQSSVLDTLAHQRLSDRGGMEVALDSMEKMAINSENTIASNMAKLLSSLLSIEAAAAQYGDYVANRSVEGGDNGSVCCGAVSECGQKLRIYIPHFGVVKIERNASSRDVYSLPLSVVDQHISIPGLDTSFDDHEVFSNPLVSSGVIVEQGRAVGLELEQREIDAENHDLQKISCRLQNRDYDQTMPLNIQAQHLFDAGDCEPYNGDCFSPAEPHTSLSDKILDSWIV